jgi:hypothetical protein
VNVFHLPALHLKRLANILTCGTVRQVANKDFEGWDVRNGLCAALVRITTLIVLTRFALAGGLVA